MRVMVTGGTGFVGSHTVAALIAAGHEVRLLVRSTARIAPALEPLGIDTARVDHVLGDVTDPRSVADAVQGCDAVLHAAAVYDLDARATRVTTATNAPGARAVLTAAAEAGCDPIVHVSSTVALLRRRAMVDADSPLSSAKGPYIVSKVESDRIARALQDDGVPVVIVMPGGVLGPHDPHLSDQMARLARVLRGQYLVWPRGGYHGVDVRDVAAVHAAVMESGRGPRRYVVPGHHLDGPTLFGALRLITGRRLPHLALPTPLLLPATRVASGVQRVVPFHLPAEHEGAVVAHHDTRVDDGRTREELGVVPRPVEETVRDSVRWLHQAGHISARQAGRAAREPGG